MWEDSLRRLEFYKIVTLLEAEASFPGGRKLAGQISPQRDLAAATRRLDETRQGVELVMTRDTSFISRAHDLEVHLRRAHTYAQLNPEELSEIASTLKVMRQCSAFKSDKGHEYINSLVSAMTDLGPLERYLFSLVDEYGQLRDDASPELKSIRQRMGTARQRIRDYLKEFVRGGENQKYLQDDVITERNGRFVVPVRQEYRNQIRGLIHDESASGATVYIEPERVVTAGNEVRKLEAEEKREIERILREASAKVAANYEGIYASLEILSELDFILARARLALSMEAYYPRLNDQGRVQLERARHPLIPRAQAVPIDVELGQGFDVLVITGPNTGGKTVTLKTVGLLTVMAMAGLFIPARENSMLSLFDQVFVDIGDEQSIEQSLSTFSSHMTNVIDVLNSMTPQSLILLDELGSGTDPQEGAALARAILENLVDKGVRAVVTTHHSGLKTLAYTNPRMQNACVEFDPVSLRPTYVLTIGLPGQSNALAIARRLGLDADIIERAAEFVPRTEIELGNMIREFKNARRETEQEKAEVRKLTVALKGKEHELEERRQQLETVYEQRLQNAEKEARRYLMEAREEAEIVIDELKNLLKDKEKIKWHQIEETRAKLKKIAPLQREPAEEMDNDSHQLLVGDYVEVRSLRQRGYILDGPSSSQEYTVQIGIMKVTASRDDLSKKLAPEEVKSRQARKTYLEKAKNISPEIDLRGQLAEEALENLEQYLENAHLAGLERIRIIHGKGTGALRSAVRDYLHGHRYVLDFSQAAPNEGGFGVTIAHLYR
ncbi:MAG: endonuclease MutS2 [Methylocystaceae bacterium]